MKIQIASDLHLEFVRRRYPGECVVQPAPEADLLVLAGDIANDLDGLEAFADWPVPVLYVLGNHEFYGQDHDELRFRVRQARQEFGQTSVLVLDNEIADFSGFGQWAQGRAEELSRLRFLGCTLWTDYSLPSVGQQRSAQMDMAARYLNDHRCIRKGDELFSPADAHVLHKESRAWLAGEIAQPFDGKTVVVTHHAPHESSVHPAYQGDDLNGAFVSHLPDLVGSVDLWIHGHIHSSMDYCVGRGRVLANPCGYGWSADVLKRQLENKVFEPMLVVEV